MPTFPLPSLKFRTAGFPQYGFKAGRSDRAFPFYASSRGTVCHCVPRFPRRIPVLCRGTLRAGAPPFERPLPLYPRGLRSGAGCSVPFHPHLRPHPPHSQAHPDFTALRLIRNAFAVHTAPRRPPSGSALSLSFLPNMPPSTTPGRSETGWFQSCGPDIGLRHVMSGSALPTVLLSASRRADFSELHWFAFAAACQVARPLCRSDQNSPATGTFTSRLPTSRSPFSPLDMTTTVSGPFCRWDYHPLE